MSVLFPRQQSPAGDLLPEISRSLACQVCAGLTAALPDQTRCWPEPIRHCSFPWCPHRPCILFFVLSPTHHPPSPVLTDFNRYPTPAAMATSPHVTYLPSLNNPVVLAAPHGGESTHDDIPSIPIRTSGCHEPDTHTIPLAHSIIAEYTALHQTTPTLVTLNLHRSLVDGNRSPKTAVTDPTSSALSAYTHYHSCIASSLSAAVSRHGFALLIDLHGQSHRPGVDEFGYLLTSRELLLADAEVDSLEKRTTMDCLIRDGTTRSKVTRGATSLNGLVEKRGFKTTPSPETPAPCSEDALNDVNNCGCDVKGREGPPDSGAARRGCYFWGGYSIRRYSLPDTIPADAAPLNPSDHGWASKVASVQIETCWEVRRTPEEREGYARAVAEAIGEFVQIHYENKL